MLPPGMSKRTSYGKIYRLEVPFVRTSVRVHVYPVDVFLPANRFLLFALTVKKRVRAGRAFVLERTKVRPRRCDYASART
jgi:hypothetical protein